MKKFHRVLNISMKKIDRVKKRFVEEGLEVALTGKKAIAFILKKLMVTLRPI